MTDSHKSCYSGLKLTEAPTKYISLLNSVIIALYQFGAVIHGGCIRDLLRGIVPKDIDVRFAYSAKTTPAACVDKLRGIPNVSAELLAECPARDYGGSRYIIAVDWNSILSSHSSIIIDLCACEGDEWSYLPIDYDVNMLYVATIKKVDFTLPTTIISADARAIATNWCILQGRYNVDCGLATASIISGTCEYPHDKCNLITLAHRYSRASRMVELKFTDCTSYQCSDSSCCAASAAAIRSHYVDKILKECNANLTIFRAKFRDHINDVARRLCVMHITHSELSYSKAVVLNGLPRCIGASYTLDDISTDSRILMIGQLNTVLLEMSNPLCIPYNDETVNGINEVASDKALASAEKIMVALRSKGQNASTYRPASPLQTLTLSDIRAEVDSLV